MPQESVPVAGRLGSMSGANEQRIDSILLEVLQESGHEMTTEDLERELAERGHGQFGRFEVRESIWRLIVERSVVLTPQRTIKAP
jgi:hypothetical protein